VRSRPTGGSGGGAAQLPAVSGGVLAEHDAETVVLDHPDVQRLLAAADPGDVQVSAPEAIGRRKRDDAPFVATAFDPNGNHAVLITGTLDKPEQLDAQSMAFRPNPTPEELARATEVLRSDKRFAELGGRDDIVQASRRLAEDVAAGRIKPSEIDEARLSASLFTAGIPDPDLLIRTSGEQRISNFLLWQSAYTELVFIDTLWPDFGRADLEKAISDYHGRERRYGASAGSG